MLVSIFLEKGKGIGGLEVLELHQHVRPPLSHRVHELVHQAEIILPYSIINHDQSFIININILMIDNMIPSDARMLEAKVERVREELGIISAGINHHRQTLGRVDSSCCCVQCQLSYLFIYL